MFYILMCIASFFVVCVMCHGYDCDGRVPREKWYVQGTTTVSFYLSMLYMFVSALEKAAGGCSIIVLRHGCFGMGV